MGSDDRSQRLDHQRFGDRVELAADPLRIRLGVRVADDHADTMAAIDLVGELDDPVQRALERADALQRGDEPVTDAKDRLDLQHRAEERAGATDPSAAPQELKSGHREVGLDVGSHLEHLGFDRLPV
jgi:hypothetical protein